VKGLRRACYAVGSSGLMDKAMAVESFAYARSEVRLLSFGVLEMRTLFEAFHINEIQTIPMFRREVYRESPPGGISSL